MRDLPLTKSGKEKHFEQQTLIIGTGSEELLYFFLCVDLNLLLRRLRPVSPLQFDVMVVVPNHVEHDGHALVDCLLIQSLIAALSEQIEEVITVEPIDEMLGDVALRPFQA